MNKRKLTDIQEADLKKQYESGVSIARLSIIFGVGKRTVVNAMRRTGTTSRMDEVSYSRKIYEDYGDSIVANYKKGMSILNLAKRYSLSAATIRKIIVKAGIRVRGDDKYRRYAINEDFFQVIDSEAKAYCLGLLLADGYVSADESNMILSLADKDVVEMVRDLMESEAEVRTYQRKKRVKPEYVFRFGSKKLCSDLISHGCTPRKSKTLAYPATVPQSLEHHFIRGYFDGDGCICVTEKSCEANFIGTLPFMERVAFVLYNQGTVGSDMPRFCKNSACAYVIRIKRKDDLRLLRDYLYTDAHYYMQRKYDKFQLI